MAVDWRKARPVVEQGKREGQKGPMRVAKIVVEVMTGLELLIVKTDVNLSEMQKDHN